MLILESRAVFSLPSNMFLCSHTLIMSFLLVVEVITASQLVSALSLGEHCFKIYAGILIFRIHLSQDA